MPFRARGRVMSHVARSWEAPRLRAANTNRGSTSASPAVKARTTRGRETMAAAMDIAGQLKASPWVSDPSGPVAPKSQRRMKPTATGGRARGMDTMRSMMNARRPLFRTRYVAIRNAGTAIPMVATNAVWSDRRVASSIGLLCKAVLGEDGPSGGGLEVVQEVVGGGVVVDRGCVVFGFCLFGLGLDGEGYLDVGACDGVGLVYESVCYVAGFRGGEGGPDVKGWDDLGLEFFEEVEFLKGCLEVFAGWGCCGIGHGDFAGAHELVEGFMARSGVGGFDCHQGVGEDLGGLRLGGFVGAD